MGFNTRKHPGGVLVVEVDGQLIVGNRQELKQKVLDALEAGSRKFLIDFTKTGYIDSSGLGLLVAARNSVDKNNGKLHLCGLPPQVKKTFDQTNLTNYFSIFATEQDALRGA